MQYGKLRGELNYCSQHLGNRILSLLLIPSALSSPPCIPSNYFVFWIFFCLGFIEINGPLKIGLDRKSKNLKLYWDYILPE